MGKRPNASDSFNFAEEKEVWESGVLGTHNAKALLATIFMNLTQHLGLRGRQDYHSMKLTDFSFGVDEDGN